MSAYLKNLEIGKAYVTSLRKLAKFICDEMKVDDVYSFATNWDEDEFIMDIGNHTISDWYGFKKISSPFDSNDTLLLLGHYGGGEYRCIPIIDDEVEVISELREYITDYAHGTTINGYVCFDPENQVKKEEESNG